MSTQNEIALAESLHWALDIIEMCDKRLVELGDPREMVYSDTYQSAKAQTRTIASHFLDANARPLAAAELFKSLSSDAPETRPPVSPLGASVPGTER